MVMVVTMGDPCGIGPEIITKAWMALRSETQYRFVVIGDARVFEGSDIDHIRLDHIGQYRHDIDALQVIHRPCDRAPISGQPNTVFGSSIISWINEATELCITGYAEALVTAPIAKWVLYESGFRHAGHTEYLAHLCELHDHKNHTPYMMLAVTGLKVVPLTIHIPVKLISEQLTENIIIHAAQAVNRALIHDYGIERPRLVMAGLNPHAGENGTIGTEEQTTIEPALKQLRNQNIDIGGPFSADSLFHETARQTYDAALCCYHDQALIPLKTIDFFKGVNVTLNLPIVRTSPDHGTGFDIAGKNIARADSMIAAIKEARLIADSRAKTHA